MLNKNFAIDLADRRGDDDNNDTVTIEYYPDNDTDGDDDDDDDPKGAATLVIKFGRRRIAKRNRGIHLVERNPPTNPDPTNDADWWIAHMLS